jgi:hypothetical protein
MTGLPGARVGPAHVKACEQGYTQDLRRRLPAPVERVSQSVPQETHGQYRAADGDARPNAGARP